MDSNNTPLEPGKKRSKKRIILLLAIPAVLACFCFTAFLMAINSSDNSSAKPTAVAERGIEVPSADEGEEPTTGPGPTDEPAREPTSEPTAKPSPTKKPTREPTATPLPTETPDPNLIRAGTYLVGSDIQPGLYKGVSGAGFFGSCYWERLKDLSGSFDAILANDNSAGQFYIEVKEGDYALKTDCDLVWLETIPEHTGGYPHSITTGTYLVGNDIQPGIYKGQAGIGNSCYWERLKSLAGDFDSILANENSVGQFYVEVTANDYAFQTGCDLEFLESIPEHTGEYPQSLEAGTYLVGSDIQPGSYSGQAGADFGESCYWERLRDVTGGFNSIIANANAKGQFYVQVQPGDFALGTTCPLEWSGP